MSKPRTKHSMKNTNLRETMVRHLYHIALKKHDITAYSHKIWRLLCPQTHLSRTAYLVLVLWDLWTWGSSWLQMPGDTYRQSKRKARGCLIPSFSLSLPPPQSRTSRSRLHYISSWGSNSLLFAGIPYFLKQRAPFRNSVCWVTSQLHTPFFI